MCEILAIASRHPARATISLRELARHGGQVGPHGDGWGFAYYEDGEAVVFKETDPASSSRWIRLIEEQGVHSTTLIFHLRKATQGRRCLGNTQPFVRELGGRKHVFVHNGDLGDVRDHPLLPLDSFRPVGDTDSERAFCSLLHDLRSVWLDGHAPPTVEARTAIVERFAENMRGLGPANFAYSDGEILFAHGDRRRHPGETVVRTPGLYALWRNVVTEGSPLVSRGLQIDDSFPDQRSVLVSSVPLTREGWIPLPSGMVLAIRAGQVVRTTRANDPVLLDTETFQRDLAWSGGATTEPFPGKHGVR